MILEPHHPGLSRPTTSPLLVLWPGKGISGAPCGACLTPQFRGEPDAPVAVGAVAGVLHFEFEPLDPPHLHLDVARLMVANGGGSEEFANVAAGREAGKWPGGFRLKGGPNARKGRLPLANGEPRLARSYETSVIS